MSTRNHPWDRRGGNGLKPANNLEFEKAALMRGPIRELKNAGGPATRPPAGMQIPNQHGSPYRKGKKKEAPARFGKLKRRLKARERTQGTRKEG